MVCCSIYSMGQRLNNKFSYSNLKGVTRIGAFVPYELDLVQSGGIEYVKVLRNKKTVTYSLSYLELDKDLETASKINFNLSFGGYLCNVGKRNYMRITIGPEAGYEWKKSKIIEDHKNFFYFGISAGFENEFFISRHIIIPIGVKQSGHYYLSNARTFTTVYAGLRFTFK